VVAAEVGVSTAEQPAEATPPERPLLEARGVKVTIGAARILRNAELELEPGELLALVGPNGAGKSTLARAVAGLQKTSDGVVTWSGRDVTRLRGRQLARLRAFIPQRPRVPAGVTVREAVTIGRSPHVGPLQRLGHHDREEIERAMERTDVLELADRMLTTLSGGELQRVQIAVGLAQDAPVLIADEPTSHLDLGAARGAARLLRGLADGGLGVLLVVHDLSLAAAVADTVVVMSNGRTVAAGKPRSVLTVKRLAEVWDVDAKVSRSGPGRTALDVDWLGEAPKRRR
jgi:iron complex transport system ATP-binding protein